MSSSYHPHAGLGYCPNLELLQFMSLATSGAYLQLAPQIDPSEPYLYDMNIYHEVSDTTHDMRRIKSQLDILGLSGLEFPKVPGWCQSESASCGLRQGFV